VTVRDFPAWLPDMLDRTVEIGQERTFRFLAMPHR
jgi:hypothetical protein